MFLPNSIPSAQAMPVFMRQRRKEEKERKKEEEYFKSPQSSFYNEVLLPPNAFALSNRKKSCTKEILFKFK